MSAAVAEAPARLQEDAPAGAAMRAAAEAQQLRELEDKVRAGVCDQGEGFCCAAEAQQLPELEDKVRAGLCDQSVGFGCATCCTQLSSWLGKANLGGIPAWNCAGMQGLHVYIALTHIPRSRLKSRL